VTEASRTAATSIAPAAAAKTTPGSAVATRTPASRGPPSVPRLSIVDEAPFEAISSSGVRASEGRIACSAGRKRVEVTPTTPGEAGDPDGSGSTGAVGEDAERDEVRPFGRDRGAPGELDSPQVLAPHDRDERPGRLCGTAHGRISPRVERPSQEARRGLRPAAGSPFVALCTRCAKKFKGRFRHRDVTHPRDFLCSNWLHETGGKTDGA